MLENFNIEKTVILLLLTIVSVQCQTNVTSTTAISPVEVDALTADPSEFPWMARLVSYFVNNQSYVVHYRGPCAGTLIARQWILTTARCVSSHPANLIADRVRVQLGKYDLKNSSDPGEEFMVAREIYLHPNYSFSASPSAFDFALIKLPRPVSVTMQVRPIQLPNATEHCHSATNYLDTNVRVDECSAGMTIGWMKAAPLETVSDRRPLKMVKLDIQPFQTCNRKLTSLDDNASDMADLASFSSSKLCAGGIDKQHACLVAAPGSPFMCRADSQRDRMLLGLYLEDAKQSTNEHHESKLGCETATSVRPSVFGRVFSILEWIESYNMTDMGSAQLTYQSGSNPLRLTGDPSSYGTKGYLEIYYNNTWGTVCDDHFTDSSAAVACRQLGISNADARIDTLRSGIAKSKARPVWLDDVICSGSESSLAQCQHLPFGQGNCGHSEDIAITCNALTATAASTSTTPIFRTTTPTLNPTNGQVRLTGGNYGFVEIYWLDRWGSVCDDGFGVVDAQVVCRQLGFLDSSTVSVLVSTVGLPNSTTSTIWLDDVNCYGYEISLSSCSHNGWGLHNCGYSENVAISCTGEYADDTLSINYGNLFGTLNSQLVTAVQTNQASIVESLLMQGASPNSVSSYCCSYSGAPVLICAGCLGYTRIAGLLIAYGADLEGRDSDGGTPLIWTSRAGNLDIVGLLITAGAVVDAQSSRFNDTALTFAADAGRYEVVRYLVQSGADVTLRQGANNTALNLARNNGYTEIAAYLAGVNQNNENVSSSDNLNSLMFVAIAAGDSDEVSLLLKQGDSPRARAPSCCITYRNMSALQCAACAGVLSTCQILVDKNADVNERNSDGFTALMAAAREGF